MEEHESETEDITRSANPNEVRLCQLALDAVLDGFTTLGTGMEWDDERRGNTLLLIVMAYNSLRWAFDLMLKGYYAQSVTLSRSAWEAWLNAVYLNLFPEHGIDNWRDFRKRPRPLKMRELVAERSAETGHVDPADFQEGLDKLYRYYSEFSHPTSLSTRIMIREKEGIHRLALGGEYDDVLMLQSTNALCIAAMKVASLFAYVLRDSSAYLARRQKTEVEWRAWGVAMTQRHGDQGLDVTPEVPDDAGNR